jgi:hypothetical protein
VGSLEVEEWWLRVFPILVNLTTWLFGLLSVVETLVDDHIGDVYNVLIAVTACMPRIIVRESGETYIGLHLRASQVCFLML